MKLTLEGLAYRALWELDCRSGFKALRTPRGHVPLPDAVVPWATWRAQLRNDHPLRAPRRRASTAAMFEEAPDWHLEPSTRKRWPTRQHWSRARTAPVGDLRLTWETNRFGHVWRWATAPSGHDAAQRAGWFAQQLHSWRHHNPFRAGVNWASGQELALRSMAWLVGADAFGGHFSRAQWHNLVELLYWHAVHIESELGFARHAVPNNHLLAESLALAQIADAFPEWREHTRWRALGLRLFREAVDAQFFEDGGYCQHSHTYHHLALELVLDAHAWFPTLRPQLERVLTRAENYLGTLLQHGALPNFGPNDRLDDPDFAALHAAVRDVVPATTPAVSASFDHAGLHLLRDQADRDRGWMAVLRAGELPDRAGHEDGLHVEVWRGATPIAVDAGSYRYGGPDHAWFAGARSHNVCSSGVTPPRELLATFTWDRVAHPTLIDFDPPRRHMRATYDAYSDIRWLRDVQLRDDRCIVTDLLDPTGEDAPDLQRIHWLLDARPRDVVIASVNNFTWTLHTPHATITIAVAAVIGHLSRPQLRMEPGWISQKYGTRRLGTSIELSTHCPAVRFRTTFSPR